MHTDLKTGFPARQGWVVVGTTFITLGMVLGIWYSYSVFLVAFLREFGWSRSLLAGGFSGFVLVHGAVSPLVGWLAGRIGPRRVILAGACVLACGLLLTAETSRWWHLYLAFGGVTAVGITMAGWLPAVVLVRGWFPNRFGTAMGIAAAGIGAGIFGLVPFAQLLIDRVGWRWAFRVLAALVVGWICPATAALIRDPPPAESSDAPAASYRAPKRSEAISSWTLATAVRDWHFWGLAGVFFSGNFATQMLMVHQVAYLVDHGVSPLAAASAGGLIGLVSIAGKTGGGALSDRTGRELAYTLASGCIVASLAALVLAGRHPASSLPYLYAVLLGLGYGGIAPLAPAAASDLFRGPAFAAIFGAAYTALCLGIALSAWTAGWIFDETGSYALAFWVAWAMAVLSPALLWVVAPSRPNPPPVHWQA
jgi:MFS family permease